MVKTLATTGAADPPNPGAGGTLAAVLARLDAAVASGELSQKGADLALTVLDALDRGGDGESAPAAGARAGAAVDDGPAIDDDVAAAHHTAPRRDADTPPGVHLRSITAQGFRGIGPAATLELVPGPGLTLVVGRNGSGKSSFAEALELLLTGDNQRWSGKRGKIWKDGWSNLHWKDERRVEAEVAIEGTGGPTTLRRTWKPDAALDGSVFEWSGPEGAPSKKTKKAPEADAHARAAAGKSAAARTARGATAGASARATGDGSGTNGDTPWTESLTTHRPFLSYNELGSLLVDGPSKLYDALASILGLGELVDAAEALEATRKELGNHSRKTKNRLKEIRTALEAALKRPASVPAGDPSTQSGASKSDAAPAGGEPQAAGNATPSGTDTDTDPRHEQALLFTKGTKWKLDDLDRLLRGSADPDDAGATTTPDDTLTLLQRLSRLDDLPLPDPAALARASSDLETRADALRTLAGTDSAAARRTADLLEKTLANYDRLQHDLAAESADPRAGGPTPDPESGRRLGAPLRAGRPTDAAPHPDSTTAIPESPASPSSPASPTSPSPSTSGTSSTSPTPRATPSSPSSDTRVDALALLLRSLREDTRKPITTPASDAQSDDDTVAEPAAADPLLDPTTCPVCKTEDVLTPAWRETTAAEIDRLREKARAYDDANAALDRAAATLRRLFAAPPQPLLRAATSTPLGQALETAGIPETATPTAALEAWRAWSELTELPRPAALEERTATLRAALSELQTAAALALEAREDAWRPHARALSAWLDDGRREMAGRDRAKHLKDAEDWLRTTTTALRNERFAPIKEQVQQTWEDLRTASSVSLDDVTFEGRATQRRIELAVTVDGEEGAALGVMSQGELHALALSLFLPRATLPQSPFRFIVIDDPVQAMDPARVDGLARVLARTALRANAASAGTATTGRQVIVFTHDNRLPEAIRRLALPATILEVEREAGSRVTVTPSLDPVERALAEARALVRTDDVPPDVIESVVPVLCRQALEAAAIESVRKRRIGRGEPHTRVEDLFTTHTRLLPRLAACLFDDPDRADAVLPHLDGKNKTWADLTNACNKGAHKGIRAVDTRFVDATGKLAEHLRSLR